MKGDGASHKETPARVFSATVLAGLKAFASSPALDQLERASRAHPQAQVPLAQASRGYLVYVPDRAGSHPQVKVRLPSRP